MIKGDDFHEVRRGDVLMRSVDEKVMIRSVDPKDPVNKVMVLVSSNSWIWIWFWLLNLMIFLGGFNGM